jgi:hypothetical protein
MMSGSDEQLDSAATDPWAVDDTAMAAAASVEETASDSAQALSKLKQSSQRLVTNLDQKLGLSGIAQAIGQSVQQVDQQAHVSETVQSARSSVTSWFQTVDQNYQLTHKSQQLGASLLEVIPTEQIHSQWQSSTRAWKELDESHGITKKAAETLAHGADMLSNSLSGEAKDDNDEETNKVDNDGLPTSFQNS